MQGLLLIDKPSSWTSFDAVNYLRKVIAKQAQLPPKKVKVGHSGTLDPFASGLLIILIGDYTKRASELLKLDKRYQFTMKLGFQSSTGDPEGTISFQSSARPGKTVVQAALKDFLGEISQRPPAYSAVKVGGKRAYQLARSGQLLELAPRRVKVAELKLITYDYPNLSLTATVSSGTYIRSLVADIGQRLGSGAYTLSLRRISIGPYSVDQAFDPRNLNIGQIEQHLIKVLPAPE